MNRILAIIITLLCSITLFGQTSEHQRLGVERKTIWELGIEAGSSVSNDSYMESDYFSLNPYTSLDILIERAWSISVQMPFVSELVLEHNSKRPAAIVIGDLSASIGWTGKVGDFRLRGGLSSDIPTGDWNPYTTREGILTGGSGRWTIGANVSISRILDPVVIGSVFSYNVGLPRVERFVTTIRPGDMNLQLFISEVLNDRIGYTIRIIQGFCLSELRNNQWNMNGFAYSLSGGGEVWFSTGDFSLRLGVSKNLTKIEIPASISLSVGYSIKSEKKK